MSLKAEDIYGAINGASRPHHPQGQQEYGGMVRIRDMLERAEKDLTRVQEERDQRRSPVPPRIFGDDLSNRYADGEDGVTSSGGPLSPSQSISTGRRQPPQPAVRRSEDSHSRLRSGAVPTIKDRADEGRGPESSVSGAHLSKEGEGEGSRRGGGGGARWLGSLIRQVAGMAIVGAALGLGAAGVSTASVWIRHHISARTQKAPLPKRDIPPWLVSAPPSLPPGSPQRAKQRRHVPGAAAAGADLPRGMSPKSQPPNTPTPKGGSRARKNGKSQAPPQSPVTHVHPLPEGDLFPSMPPPDVNVAKG